MWISKFVTGGNIREKHVTRVSILIPPKHRVDSLSKLRGVGFINTAGVDLSVYEAIILG